MKTLELISKKDLVVLSDLVDSCDFNTDIILAIARKRLKVLTNDHIIMIGYLIGASLAARSLWGEIQNSIDVCQRQN